MTDVKTMLEYAPADGNIDLSALAAAIETCFQCAQTCTACSDACLGEGTEELRCCVTMCANCADICATTGRVLTRRTAFDPNIARAAVQACIDSCRACATECESHDRDHCKACAQACRRCEQVCGELLGALGA